MEWILYTYSKDPVPDGDFPLVNYDSRPRVPREHLGIQYSIQLLEGLGSRAKGISLDDLLPLLLEKNIVK